MSKLTLKEEVVRVENLEDLCEIVRYNNNVFAHHINKLDARSRSTRKWLGIGFLAAGLACFTIEARFCNVEDRLKKQEERLGIATEEE
jgi:hypothetical protein